MSWLLSVFITGFIITNSTFPVEELIPQIVYSTSKADFQGDETEKIERILPLNSDGRISIDNLNGSIEIEGWDKNEVKLEAVKFADSREKLNDIQVKIDSKPDYLRINTEFGRNGSYSCSGYCRLEVRYKLIVPRNANLNKIETVNGSITVSNLRNYLKASAVNGTVKADNLQGTADIETVNGTTEISFDKMDNQSKINLTTVNGKVNLLIPSDSDATIRAETTNGVINNDFNLPVRKGKYIGRDLYGKLGEGIGKIRLEAVNGSLNIKRQQDGKSMKSVTNLLNMKETTDEVSDADMESNINIDVDKMNKEIAKSVKESTKNVQKTILNSTKLSQKATLEAMKETSAELERLQKELQNTQIETERDAIRMSIDAIKATQNALRSTNWTISNDWSDFGNRKIEEKSGSFSVKPNSKVSVIAKNCVVSVRGWDKDEVKYRLVKRTRGISTNGDVTVNKSDNEISIITNTGSAAMPVPPPTPGSDSKVFVPAPDGMDSSNSYRIEVFVPKKSNLRILTNKEIRVEGVSGNLDLSGGEEAINVRDSEGKLKLTSTDALIRVIGFSGEVFAKTGTGIGIFEGDFTKFNATTDDGKIILTLPEDTNADFETDSEIQTQGFDLNETDKENVYRIGDGGRLFNIKVGNGEIFVRNNNSLNSRL